MRYLLDVNALLALGVMPHIFHSRVAHWLRHVNRLQAPELLTCSITELAFVRISSSAPIYGFTVPQAMAVLERLKRERKYRFSFIPDILEMSQMPKWVAFPKQLTDGHLAGLANAHGAVLATLDVGIPGAFLIPN